jgi:hypothetical protein
VVKNSKDMELKECQGMHPLGKDHPLGTHHGKKYDWRKELGLIITNTKGA